ncbi:MAG: hypothetical protein JW969_18335 [Spirochaetales bacterium]|nr:hypothetical protein [Spirochaetales bacterium]
MFIPQFCPNKYCKNHNPNKNRKKWFYHYGFYNSKAFGRTRRFQCKTCQKTFSVQTFKVDYFAKKTLPYQSLTNCLISSMSIRSLARFFHVSTGTIANKLERLNHQCIIKNRLLLKDFKLKEDVVADGFETYAVSRYFPENINVLVGKNSQFVYSFNHVTFRRKGRMTRKQKKKRSFLDKIVKFQYKGIFKSFRNLLDELTRLWDPAIYSPIILFTDEKIEYAEALKSNPYLHKMKQNKLFNHVKINSQELRNKKNPLFSVNYMDREFRKDLAAYRRKTACNARNVSAAMGRLSIYSFHHNYIKQFRINNRSEYHETHAFIAGIPNADITGILNDNFFENRYFLSHYSITKFEMDIWMKRLKTPLKKGEEYVPAYYVA